MKNCCTELVSLGKGAIASAVRFVHLGVARRSADWFSLDRPSCSGRRNLDEGALWVRGTLAPSAGPNEGICAMNQARILLCSRMTGPIRQAFSIPNTRGFETKGTVAAWIPRGQGQLDRGHESRSQYHAVGGFSQPIEDNTEEAVSGVKGESSTGRVSEEYLGEFFEGGLGEQLGFAEAGGVILFAANADAEDGVALEDVERSDKATDPESFLA
jgi:hypothetical protein